MKAVVTHKFHTSVKDVHVSNISRPEPKPDEILIQVIAAGVNFVDTLYVNFSIQFLLPFLSHLSQF